jgi:hypothetical protein
MIGYRNNGKSMEKCVWVKLRKFVTATIEKLYENDSFVYQVLKDVGSSPPTNHKQISLKSSFHHARGGFMCDR